MTTTMRRASVATIAALAALGFAAPSASAATSNSDAAASYLAGQLAASNNTFTVGTYPDYGLSADAILALAATGTATTQATAAVDAFRSKVGDYTTYGDARFAGATAKAALVAETAGENPRAFGGQDLVSSLQKLEGASGRFSDDSTFGDYSNTISQSLAIIALHRAGAPVDDKAVSYLLSLRCADGGFKMQPADAGCTSDSDGTSFAVQALSAVGGHQGDVTKSAQYLVRRQGADGGIGGGVSTSGANANSTGLAAVALRLAGDTVHAAKATAYVKALQLGCDVPASLRGAISYNTADHRTALKSKEPVGNEVRSTTQAVLALTSASYLTTTLQGTAATPTIDCSSTAPAKPGDRKSVV